ncbi:MAG TPA: head decoration protein [Rhodospirillaceae bacterium]|nr:head decoration protein [Rhodospirillaceae bacterium]
MGVYKVTFIETVENLGTFSVEAPDGTNVGTGVVATEFTGGGLTFTIADGATDFAAGDQFAITVANAGGAGEFSVKTPSGYALPNLTVGAAYTGDHINLTVADGSTDWAVGAVINVTVSGTGEFSELAPAAFDGSQIAAGVLYDAVDASLADAPAVAVVRNAELNAAEISWPDAITDGQKAVALAQLSAINLIAR